jgi:adenosine deaminase
MAIASMDGKAEAGEIQDQMMRHMRAWPSVTSVIAVGKKGKGKSRILVGSRPDAIRGGSLQDVYEVMKRLSSSPSIKEAAKRWPSGFHVVKALNAEGTLHEVQLPGGQTPETLSLSLKEGGAPNRLDQVRALVESLPKGRRVALLLAGPSGAGKSSLIGQIRDFAKGQGRSVTDLQGDMYFNDIDSPKLPRTPDGSPYWDSTENMDMTRFKEDIASLIRDGKADTPIYNFKDIRPGGWRLPDVKFTGFREEKPRRIELGVDDILVIDSLHAANGQIISHLDSLGLPHATIYLDSERSEDRLVRRLVRDYNERGGILPRTSLDVWDRTTWPGEVEFVRPTILQMDPARDTFLVTKFPKDLGLSREEIERKVTLLEQYGLPPSHVVLRTPEDKLGELQLAEEKRLEELLKSGTMDEQARVRTELERMRAAPFYHAVDKELSDVPAAPQDPSKLMEAVKRLPKVDLHRHLEGAVKAETILRIAQKHGIELPASTAEGLKPYVSVTENDKTLLDFIRKFDIIGKIFVSSEAIREISRQCVLDAKEENIAAMELRFSPMYMASARGLDLHKVMDAVIEGVREGEKETGITVALTTIIERQMGPGKAKEMEDLTEEYVRKGALAGPSDGSKGFGKVTSIDLANDEFHFPPGPYAPVFQEAESEGIHRTVHAGEALGAESVRSAVGDCRAERIGHGIRSFEDPRLVQDLVSKGTVLEMCPTSNLQTQAIDKIENHPLKKFYDMGGRPTINSDDPAVCDTDLNKEYFKALTRMGCTLADVEQMILYAVDAMFIPPPVKAALHREILSGILQVNVGLK